MVFALLAGALLLLKSDRGRRTGVVLAAGVFLTIAALFKEVAVLFTTWCAAYLLWICWQDHRPAFQRLFALGMPTMLGLVLWGGWAWKLSPEVFASTMNRWGNRWRLYDMLYTASSEGIERRQRAHLATHAIFCLGSIHLLDAYIRGGQGSARGDPGAFSRRVDDPR